MYVKDYMTTPVITVSSSTLITDAQKLMKDKGIHRLPVVDDGRLVGIVTATRLREFAPSPATSLSVWELHYILSKLTVAEAMERNVVTLPPDMTIDDGAQVAREHRLGALPVVDEGRLVGIITETDMFRILSQVLGSRKNGWRLHIHDGYDRIPMSQMGEILQRHNARVYSLFPVKTTGPDQRREVVMRVQMEDPSSMVEELRSLGCTVEATP